MTMQSSKQCAEQRVPIFKVFADHGKHPAVAMDRPVCVSLCPSRQNGGPC